MCRALWWSYERGTPGLAPTPGPTNATPGLFFFSLLLEPFVGMTLNPKPSARAHRIFRARKLSHKEKQSSSAAEVPRHIRNRTPPGPHTRIMPRALWYTAYSVSAVGKSCHASKGAGTSHTHCIYICINPHRIYIYQYILTSRRGRGVHRQAEALEAN